MGTSDTSVITGNQVGAPDKNQSEAGYRVLNRDVIKYIAMFTMLLNHIAQIFLVRGTVLWEIFEDIGYFTAPVMCYFLVEGYAYTKSKKKYGQRLLLFALISQVPFYFAFGFGMMWNMLFTLFICFLVLVAKEKISNGLVRNIVCVLLVLLTISSDWPLFAAAMTATLYDSHGNKKKMAISYGVIYVLFCVTNAGNFMGMGYTTAELVFHAALSGIMILVAAVTVLCFYNGKRAEHGRNFSKWFFYIFYPAHLTILWLIRDLMIAG